MAKLRFLTLTFVISLIGAAPPQDNPADDGFIHTILDVHNQARADVGVPPLVWNAQLARHAANWARSLARSGKLIHASAIERSGAGGVEGESFASGTTGFYTPEQFIRLWIDQKPDFVNDYVPRAHKPGKNAGYYSQIVWRRTTSVGCGMASGGGKDYLVCRYLPGGNMDSEKPY